MRAVFLDRDGTIARDVGYCSRVEDFVILPGVPEAIRLLGEHGFKVVVITNQSGIGRGYFSEEALHLIHRHMLEELAKHGARVDAIYHCPHHPDDGCDCRKPRPGMLLRAAEELGIDLGGSYMVGDAESDVGAGKAAGCRTARIATPTNPQDADPADHTAADLLSIARWIIENAASPIRGR